MVQSISGLDTPKTALQSILPSDSSVQDIDVDLDPIVTNSKDQFKDKYLPSQPNKALSALKIGSFTEHGIYMNTSLINLDSYSLDDLKSLLWYLNKDVRDAKEDLVTMERRWDNAPFFDKYPFGWVDYLVARGYVEGKIQEIEAYIPTVENKIRQMESAKTLTTAGNIPVTQLAQVDVSEVLQKISELKSQKAQLVNELNQLKSELDTAPWYKTPLIAAQIAFKGIEIFNKDMEIGMWEKGGPTVRPT